MSLTIHNPNPSPAIFKSDNIKNASSSILNAKVQAAKKKIQPLNFYADN